MKSTELERIHLGIIAGDTAAQRTFEAAVRPYALGIATHRGLSTDDAEEIWNDAFRIGLERAATNMPLGRLRAYVLSVAHKAAVDRVRLRVRRSEVQLGAAQMDIESVSARPDKTASSVPEPTLAILRLCVEAASTLHREVITMAANGLTAREIAAALDLTEANAAKVRQRARAWFKWCLNGVAP